MEQKEKSVSSSHISFKSFISLSLRGYFLSFVLFSLFEDTSNSTLLFERLFFGLSILIFNLFLLISGVFFLRQDFLTLLLEIQRLIFLSSLLLALEHLFFVFIKIFLHSNKKNLRFFNFSFFVF